MQTIGLSRIHANISYDTPLFNIKINGDILKALPFKKCAQFADFKLCLKIFSDLDCFNIIKSE